MLTLRLTPYTSTEWSWDGEAYVTGDHASRVVPHPHPTVEQLAATDGDRTLLVIRERVAGPPAGPAHLGSW